MFTRMLTRMQVYVTCCWLCHMMLYTLSILHDVGHCDKDIATLRGSGLLVDCALVIGAEGGVWQVSRN